MGHAAALSVISQTSTGPISQSQGLTAFTNADSLRLAREINAEDADTVKLTRERAALVEKERPAVVALKDKYEALSKTITDFDLSKLAELAPITEEGTGKVLATVQSQIDNLLKPINDAGKEIAKEFEKIKPQIKRADLLPDYEGNIKNLKERLDKLNTATQGLGITIFDQNKLKKDSKTFTDAVADAAKSIDIYKDSIEALNKTIGETFGRIAEQAAKIPKVEADLTAYRAGVPRKDVDELANAIKGIKKTAAGPTTKDTKKELDDFIDSAITKYDELSKKIPDFYKLVPAGLKGKLLELKDELSRVGDSFDAQGVFQNKIKAVIGEQSELEIGFKTRLSAALTQSADDFREWESKSVDPISTVIGKVQELTRETEKATRALKGISLPTDVSVVKPTSPVGAGVTAPGYMQGNGWV